MTEQTGGRRRESLKQQDSAAGVLQGAVSRRLVLWNCVVFLSSYLYFYSIPFSLKKNWVLELCCTRRGALQVHVIVTP